MRRKYPVLVILGIFTLFSCTKTAITPQSNNNSNPPGTFQFTTAALNTTSYTSSAPINLNGAHDITISGKSITGGSGPGISLSNCYNVHITQNSVGNSTDVGIYLYHCHNITVDYNYITNVATGVYVDHPTGGGTVVDNNQFLNMQGPFPRGQFVQFNNVNGAGNEIKYNKGENILSHSSTQEGINLYMSNGTPSSPILITGNWIRGGGPGNASGGIQLGDTGGSYETATDNILVNPGQMGLSISGGDHLSFINNTVYSEAQYFTNVGVVVWGQAGYSVTNATVSGNKVKFMNSANTENDRWIASGNPTPAGWGSNSWGAGINASVLPAVIISPAAAKTPIPASGGPSSPGGTSQTNSPPIVMSGKSNVTISKLIISGGQAPCIRLVNCSNVYITACDLENSSDAGIVLDNCSNITIEKNNIFNVAAGIVANNCPGGNINILTNQMKNMQGPAYSGAFVQFVNVGGVNNNISYNKLQNILGHSNPQKSIDIVSSNGTAAQPITLDSNWIRGGGPDNSGGGIDLGDNGGSNQVATNNILADPGQFGLAVSGGNHISLTGNTIYGKTQSFTNVGIYVWAQNGHAISNCQVSGNRVKFKNSSNSENDNWLASGETTPSGWDSNKWGADINESVLPANIVSF